MLEMPSIDEELCNGCGICVDVCPRGALAVVGNEVVFTATEDCDYCGECEAVCPQGAICCAYEIVMEPREKSQEKQA